MTINKYEYLIRRLRYMGRQYAAGQQARGGNEQKHYLEEAADALWFATATPDRIRRVLAALLNAA